MSKLFGYLPMSPTPGEMFFVVKTVMYLAHLGQTRRGGEPYFEHPNRVARDVGCNLFFAALLHDVLEDSKFTPQDLLDVGIDRRTVDLVCILTHGPSCDYIEYIHRIGQDVDAARIKLADIADNMASDPSPRQIAKYTVARAYLEKVVADHLNGKLDKLNGIKQKADTEPMPHDVHGVQL